MKTSPLVGCCLPFRIAGCPDNDADSVADVNDLFDLKILSRHQLTLDSELQVFLPADARPTLRGAGILPGKHSFERFSSETNFETLKGASESHL